MTMDNIIDEMIQIIEKDEAFKKVFVIPEQKYNSTKFIAYIDNECGDKQKSSFINDIKFLTNYYDKYASNKMALDQTENKLTEYRWLFDGDYLFEYDIYQLAYFKIILTLYVALGRVSYEYVLEHFEKDKKPLLDSNGNAILTLYRGQSDYQYDLLPSIYRNLDYNGIMTYKQLCDLYHKSGLYSKYEKTIGGSSGIDYCFISFMQHSISYSPLLDFTTDENIALIFSTDSANTNYNKYKNTDASLYVLKLNDYFKKGIDNKSLSFSNHRVQFYKNKLKFHSTIFDKPLVYCMPDDFIVDSQVCLTPSNDRMKYQKGAFLYFEKCVIVNGVMFFPYSLGVIEKYRIKCAKNAKVGVTSKEIIQRELVGKKPQLSIDHLLNPYYYFSEYTLE